jgi:hypothetical protein
VFKPERPNPPHLTRSKKAPEGQPVQRIAYRAQRVTPPQDQEPAKDRTGRRK